MKEFKYEIIKKMGVISASPDGRYTMEVNLISYNDATPKIDIRKWDTVEGKMGKGIALNKTEVHKLLDILGGVYAD